MEKNGKKKEKGETKLISWEKRVVYYIQVKKKKSRKKKDGKIDVGGYSGLLEASLE